MSEYIHVLSHVHSESDMRKDTQNSLSEWLLYMGYSFPRFVLKLYDLHWFFIL